MAVTRHSCIESRIQAWGGWIGGKRRGSQEGRARASTCGGGSATGGRGTVRLGRRWRDVAWPGKGAAGGDAVGKHADGRKPSRVMADYRGYPWPAAGA